ncbi:MAG: endolytic transglycosylase MltG [Myxococcales bacterium]|nr:MAG: endolytic transglycosylase MltG [Myxococcales bacterium]
MAKRKANKQTLTLIAGSLGVLIIIALAFALFSYKEAREKRAAYRARHVRVTIPEGFDTFMIGARLQKLGVIDAQSFISACEDERFVRYLGLSGHSLEGYLFPDTYEFLKESSAAIIVEKMVNNYKNKSQALWDDNRRALDSLHDTLGWSSYEVLILASIIEKEAQRKEEQAIIAGVFLNRLTSTTFSPKRLQADPTLAYGCKLASSALVSCARFDGKHLGKTQRMDPQNPYNTYFIEGLPPGPISNPGLSAMTAVLKPKKHDFLYFVSRGDGSHLFSRTLDKHQQGINKYLKKIPTKTD